MTSVSRPKAAIVLGLAAAIAMLSATAEARNFDRSLGRGPGSSSASEAGATSGGPTLDLGLDRLGAGLGGTLPGDPDRCHPFSIHADDCG